MVKHYDLIKKQLSDQTKRSEEAEEVARRIVDGASGLSKKGKRRVKAILREMGGLPWEEQEGEDED